MRRHGIQAFTLIELMIVIAIIGILAGIMVPNYMQARAEANMSACKQNIMAIANAIEMYRVRNQDVWDGTDMTKSSSVQSTIRSDSCLIEQGFLSKVPKCPASGRTYLIYYTRNGYAIFHSQKNDHGNLGGGYGPVYCNKMGMMDTLDSQSKVQSWCDR